jgi:peptidoglycan/LPS O-acetylase OafA/YrhL
MFRMILALLVFASHVSTFEVGRPAVMIFFILSGYWVVRLFDGSNDDVARFEMERFLRVWPIFAIVAVFGLFAERASGIAPSGNLLSTLPLLGLASREGDLLGVSWSLDIEMQFYLMLPLVALVMTQVGSKRDTSRWLLMLGLITVIGAGLLSQGVVTVAAYAPAFAAGAAIWRYRWSPPFRTAMVSMLAFVAVGVVMYLAPDLRTLLLKTESQWWRDLVHLGWCLLLAPFIAWNVHQASGAIDRHLGNLSYPFYLLHPLIIVLAAALLGPLHIAGKLVALAATLLATLLLYAVIDRPIDRLRKAKSRGVVSAA